MFSIKVTEVKSGHSYAWEAGHVLLIHKISTGPVSENNGATEWRRVGETGKGRLLECVPFHILQQKASSGSLNTCNL